MQHFGGRVATVGIQECVEFVVVLVVVVQQHADVFVLCQILVIGQHQIFIGKNSHGFIFIVSRDNDRGNVVLDDELERRGNGIVTRHRVNLGGGSHKGRHVHGK
eukprot:scaffold36927_cov183-Amphora_coffeaeformis.AAC.1